MITFKNSLHCFREWKSSCRAIGSYLDIQPYKNEISTSQNFCSSFGGKSWCYVFFEPQTKAKTKQSLAFFTDLGLWQSGVNQIPKMFAPEEGRLMKNATPHDVFYFLSIHLLGRSLIFSEFACLAVTALSLHCWWTTPEWSTCNNMIFFCQLSERNLLTASIFVALWPTK